MTSSPLQAVLWRYKFSQLKGSSDDGKTRVKLLFKNAESQQIEMKVSSCKSCTEPKALSHPHCFHHEPLRAVTSLLSCLLSLVSPGTGVCQPDRRPPLHTLLYRCQSGLHGPSLYVQSKLPREPREQLRRRLLTVSCTFFFLCDSAVFYPRSKVTHTDHPALAIFLMDSRYLQKRPVAVGQVGRDGGGKILFNLKVVGLTVLPFFSGYFSSRDIMSHSVLKCSAAAPKGRTCSRVVPYVSQQYVKMQNIPTAAVFSRRAQLIP